MSELKNKNEVKSKQISISSFFNQIKSEEIKSSKIEDGRLEVEKEPSKPPEEESVQCPVCLDYIRGLEKLNLHIVCCSSTHQSKEILGKFFHLSHFFFTNSCFALVNARSILWSVVVYSFDLWNSGIHIWNALNNVNLFL